VSLLGVVENHEALYVGTTAAEYERRREYAARRKVALTYILR
jgi:hypothetical protein